MFTVHRGGERVALFMMKPNKALGSDGFIAGFYQQHWNLLGMG